MRADERDDDADPVVVVGRRGGRASAPGRGHRGAREQLREPFGAVLPAIDALGDRACRGRTPDRPRDRRRAVDRRRALPALARPCGGVAARARATRADLAHAFRRCGWRGCAREGELVEIGAQRAGVHGGRGAAAVRGGAGVSADEATVAALTAAHGGMGRGALSRCALAARARRLRRRRCARSAAPSATSARYLASEVLGDMHPDARQFLQRHGGAARSCAESCATRSCSSPGSRDRLRALARTTCWWSRSSTDRAGIAVTRSYVITCSARSIERTRTRRVGGPCAGQATMGSLRTPPSTRAPPATSVRCSTLIDEHALELVRTGRSRTIVRWMRVIPRDGLPHSPGVLVAGIGAAHVSGRPAAEIRRLLGARPRGRAAPRRLAMWT